MTTVLAISPHLDDAVFSAGGTLAGLAQGGARVVVLTCFTGSVANPTGFALACQLDKGLAPDIDYMALRRAEDEAACAIIGAEAVHLPHREAPHRGYADAAALFGAIRPDDAIVPELANDLAEAIASYRPALVLGPLGIGGHVDHLQVRAAMADLAGDFALIRWADYPYAMRAPETLGELAARRLSPFEAAARGAAVEAYASQIGFQFGGRDAAREAFAAQPCEYFSAAIPNQTALQDD